LVDKTCCAEEANDDEMVVAICLACFNSKATEQSNKDGTSSSNDSMFKSKISKMLITGFTSNKPTSAQQ